MCVVQKKKMLTFLLTTNKPSLEIIILEDGHMEPPREFWDALGGRPDSIPTAPPTEDEKMEKQWEASDKLYR